MAAIKGGGHQYRAARIKAGAMSGFEGALAVKLDFGELPTRVTSTSGRGRAGLRLAARPASASGPDKYRTLEQRRRAAQRKARHLLDQLETEG